MKIIKILTDEEVRQKLPAQLLDALNATDPTQIMYCNRCDGLRLKEHECLCWNCHNPMCPCPDDNIFYIPPCLENKHAEETKITD